MLAIRIAFIFAALALAMGCSSQNVNQANNTHSELSLESQMAICKALELADEQNFAEAIESLDRTTSSNSKNSMWLTIRGTPASKRRPLR